MSYGTVQAEKMTTESGYSLGAGNASSFKNRIINGAMVIDQRNAGAAVTNTVGATFPVDRFRNAGSASSKFTGQQSTTAPSGFTYSLLMTSLSSYSVGAAETFEASYQIEGYDFASFNWGSASAQTVTLSFWVRASITGNYAIVLQNNGNTRTRLETYTVNSADTWELKTITITGDTTGTWNTTNSRGLIIRWDLGCGSNWYGTPGSWSGTEKYGVSGCVSLVGTSGATLYITGVQLEVGTVATSFDFRSIGTELGLCQRYYQHQVPTWGTGRSTDNYCHSSAYFKVTMRTNPTLTLVTNIYGQTPVSIQNQTADYYVTAVQIGASSSFAATFNASAEL